MSTSKMLVMVLTIVLVLSALFLVSGCETKETYTTIIRMNPNGGIEEWKTCSGVTWNNDSSITFIPLKLSHSIRITGNLTVYETVVIVEKEKTEKKK